MTLSQWILLILAVQVIHFIGTWRLYKLAGEKSWSAIIPIYNAIVLMRIIGRSKWWMILFFIPVVNLLFFIIVWVETVKSFGKNSWKDIILVIATLGLYLVIVNYDKNISYIQKEKQAPKSPFGQWISDIAFAVIFATIVHSYFIQPYIIPTGSLEKTLLIGDFLFVSKFHHGARVPTTPVSFPMVHDTIPVLKVRSYLKKPQLPFFRLPSLKDVTRNEIVVFNWPADTVRKFFVKEKGVKKPLDKKSNYVKRCVGLPGDTLEIIDGFVFIDGKQNLLNDRAKLQFSYTGYKEKGISSKELNEQKVKEFTRKYSIKGLTQETYQALAPYLLGVISSDENGTVVLTSAKGIPIEVVQKYRIRNISEILSSEKQLLLTLSEAKKLQQTSIFDSLVRRVNKKKTPNTSLFPNQKSFDWNEDNFGPLIIPRKGLTLPLTPENLPLYKKVIREYEGNTLTKNGNTIYINGQEATEYTFNRDYYWMMGDNRHRSEDSRYWGFVPDNHILGTPILIWFSIDGINDGIRNWKIRWDRVMTTVSGNGKPISFFPYFLIVFISWLIFDYLRKKKKAKQNNDS